MGENKLRPRSVETELRLYRRASYRIPSRQPKGHRVKPDGRKPFQNSKITDVYILYMIYILIIGIYIIYINISMRFKQKKQSL